MEGEDPNNDNPMLTPLVGHPGVQPTSSMEPSSSSSSSSSKTMTPFVNIDPNVCWTGNTMEGISFTMEPVLSQQSNLRVAIPKAAIGDTRFNPLKECGEEEDPPSPMMSTRGKRIKLLSSELAQMCKKTTYETEKLDLRCEWLSCQERFREMEPFMRHVSGHVAQVEVRESLVDDDDDDEDDDDEDLAPKNTFACNWQACHFESRVSKDMVRHVHYHAFHTKIKCHGLNILQETGIAPCTSNEEQCNIVPELPEPFRCLWKGCEDGEVEFPEAQRFYWHVQTHPDGEPFVAGRVDCRWKDCNFFCAKPYKLKDHLRSHSQERRVGCPNCGSLFANRSKFYDHCKRQLPPSEQNFECSYCQKKFSLERLLRNHVRAHVNAYKCPSCDMTCTTRTTLAKHITYKHSDLKPYACELCEYRAKSNYDLTNHLLIHCPPDQEYCQFEGCNFSARHRSTLTVHVKKKHLQEGSVYLCHLCDQKFKRGHYLSKHLKNIHNFQLPHGHSKFRYHRDGDDGCFRVQTVRFESEDLVNAEQLFHPGEDGSQPNSNPDDDLTLQAMDDEDMEEDVSSSIGGSASVRSEAFEVCSSVGGSTSVRSEAFEVCSSVGGSTSVRSEAFDEGMVATNN